MVTEDQRAAWRKALAAPGEGCAQPSRASQAWHRGRDRRGHGAAALGTGRPRHGGVVVMRSRRPDGADPSSPAKPVGDNHRQGRLS